MSMKSGSEAAQVEWSSVLGPLFALLSFKLSESAQATMVA